MKKKLTSVVTILLLTLVCCFALNTDNVSAAQQGYLAMDNTGTWYYYVGDAVDWNYTGMASNENGWFYVSNGKLDWNYTGMACNEYGWWYMTNGVLDFGYTGMACNENGWFYFSNGMLDWGYTGMACNEYGWWYIRNGALDFGYTGMACNENGWFYFSNGMLDWNYTGMACNEYGWWYIRNGAIDLGYTGMACNEYNWWYFTNGILDLGYTGMAYNENGWWYYTNGTIDWNYTGMACNENGWWYYTNGTLDWNYTGMACNEYDWWYYTNGTLDWNYTGMACNEYDWWYYKNGHIDFGYTGLGYNEYGYWYYKDGHIDFGYNGTYKENGISYTVTGGHAVPVKDNNSETEFVPGNAISGNLTGDNVYYITSLDNNYALTVSPDKTAEGGYNICMQPLTGSNYQKFRVLESNGNYLLMSMAYFDDNNINWLLNTTNFGYNNDNIQLTPDSVFGGKSWSISETETGVYTIKAVRGDDEQFLLTSIGGVYNKANVACASANGSNEQKFHFVKPYTNTLADGVYSIRSNENTSYAVGVENYSMKDNAALVLNNVSSDSNQDFYITCVNATEGIYTIENVNSERYIDNNGSLTSDTGVKQLFNTGCDDQRWYIQKNTDGTYSFVSVLSNKYLAAPTINSALIQKTGSDVVSEKFVLTKKENNEKTLETALYTIDGRTVRTGYIGNGIYTLYDTAKASYIGANGNGSDYNRSEYKWVIKNSGNGYTICSVSDGRYWTSNGMSDSAVAVSVSKNNSTDYSKKYDTSVLDHAFDVDNVQIITRLNMLGLSKDDFMNPEAKMAAVEAEVDKATGNAPSQTVTFNGTDVNELNEFLLKNKGKTVKLGQDISVYNSGTDEHPGTVMIPADTMLDGNGHALNLKSGSAVPTTGIIFHTYNTQTGKFEVSNNAGVCNLTTNIRYSQYAVVLEGASNVVIENNKFNAGSDSHGICISSNAVSKNVKVINNVINATGGDGISVTGNQSNIVISGNTITNVAGKAGVLVSCFEKDPIRVDQETTGPHDIVVTDNKIDTITTGCAIYFIGTYGTYIKGNSLSNSYLEGICLDGGCIGTYFAENEVSYCSKIGGLPGVSVDNGIYNIIDNNKVHNNGASGIKLVRTALGNIVVNNTCYDNSVNTFNVDNQRNDETAGILIRAQKVDAVDGDNIDGTGSNGNLVINNTIYGSHDAAINVDLNSETGSCSGNTVMYNNIKGNYDFSVLDSSTSANTVKNNIK